jgi:SagB-type dehydrogenase family enzyme
VREQIYRQETIMSEESIGREFMLKSQRKYHIPAIPKEGDYIPPLELPIPPDASLIQLPDPMQVEISPMDVRTAILERVTRRKYSGESISLAELSFLLWATQGVKSVTSRPTTLRTVPSAGARHAFETFLLVNNVEGLEPGLYRFAAIEHALIRLDAPSDIHEQIVGACANQNHVHTSAVTFIWVAILERMKNRYGERGYRYLHLDAGHICQNLYLAAEVIRCGVCAVCAFDDDAMNASLGLDGADQFAVYLGTLGRQSA